jgi:hypothetical protein
MPEVLDKPASYTAKPARVCWNKETARLAAAKGIAARRANSIARAKAAQAAKLAAQLAPPPPPQVKPQVEPDQAPQPARQIDPARAESYRLECDSLRAKLGTATDHRQLQALAVAISYLDKLYRIYAGIHEPGLSKPEPRRRTRTTTSLEPV